MKLYVLSDLHLEFQPFEPDVQAVHDADVIVLAGDIGEGVNGMRWASRHFRGKRVFYVPGNHEFYGYELHSLLKEMRRLQEELSINILDDEARVVDGIRFLGCTLWTDFDYLGSETRSQAMQAAGRGMNDYHLIRHQSSAANPLGSKTQSSTSKLSPIHSRERHLKSVKWLEARLAEGHSDSTVVITHHLPHRECVAQRYRNDLLTCAFASDLGHLMGKAKLWIHGHTHDGVDTEVQGTRIICNPRGYPIYGHPLPENRDFVPSMLVEV